MVITSEELFHILGRYGITEVANHTTYRNSERALVLVETEDYHFYLKGETQVQNFVEKTCVFAKILAQKGFPFSRFLKTNNECFTFLYEDTVFTLEEVIEGNETSELSNKHIQSIAKHLAWQHKLSETIDFTFDSGTSWGMFGGNLSDQLGEYDENELTFREFASAFGHHDRFPEIQQLYKEKRDFLAARWEQLPKGPVQGDFCHYNMTFSETGEIQGVFDFNIAGDEVFINECVAVGVYLAWHTAYKGNLTQKERFCQFLKAYQEIRPFQLNERTCITPLVQVIRAFRFDRVDKGISMKKSERVSFLQKTYAILNEDVSL